ncbi:MAG: AAA family ATPase [Synechococcaceae cyanobacterium]|nr:AAA family ATPase [Synechococcaceae cyanobacterium]
MASQTGQTFKALVSLHHSHRNKTPKDQFGRIDASSPWVAAELEIPELLDHILSGKAWIACQLSGSRSAAAAGPSDLIVIDVDGDLTLEAFWAHPFAQRHCLFSYTSCSHGDLAKQQESGSPVADRFRAIFCCEVHDDPALHGAIYRQLIERLGLQLADNCGEKPERLWYGNTNAEVRFGEGQPLAWDLVEAARETLAEQAAQAATLLPPRSGDDALDDERAEAVLLTLLRPSADGEYESYWQVVLNAAASSPSEAVHQAFMEWHGRGHHSKTQKGVARRFAKAGRKSTVGKLFKLAKEQHGAQWWRQLPQRLWYGGGDGLSARRPRVLFSDPQVYVRGDADDLPPQLPPPKPPPPPAPATATANNVPPAGGRSLFSDTNAAAGSGPIIPDAVSEGQLARARYREQARQGRAKDSDSTYVDQLFWRLYRLSVEYIDETPDGAVSLNESEVSRRIQEIRNELYALPLYAREPWQIDEWLIITFQQQHGLKLRSRLNMRPRQLFTRIHQPKLEDYLIPDQILRGRDYVLYGRQGTGKTLFALMMARAVIAAPGHAAFLDATPVPPEEYGLRRVLYVASDGGIGAQDDIERYIRRHQIDDTAWLRHLDVVSGNEEENSESWSMGLYDLHRLTQWLDEAKDAGRPYAMVVFDSLKAICPRGVRVGDQLITQYLQLVQAITAPRGVTALYIHHESKEGGGAQGAAGILEVVTGVFRLKKAEDRSRIFSIEKTRTDPKGDREIPFQISNGQLKCLMPSSGDPFVDDADDGRAVLLQVMRDHHIRHLKLTAHLSSTDPGRFYKGLSNNDLAIQLRATGVNHPALRNHHHIKGLTSRLSKEKLIVYRASAKAWRLAEPPSPPLAA